MHFSLTDKNSFLLGLFFFFLLLLVLVHFCSECNRVWFRLFQSTSQGNSTSTQPQVESFENYYWTQNFCFVLYWTWFALNPTIIYWSKLPLAFRPSRKVCVSDTFQASIFFDDRKDSLPHPSLIVAVLFGNLEILFGCQFCRILHKVNICMLWCKSCMSVVVAARTGFKHRKGFT